MGFSQNNTFFASFVNLKLKVKYCLECTNPVFRHIIACFGRRHCGKINKTSYSKMG